MNRLTISRITVRHVMGIAEEATFDVGKVCVLEGGNAQGKTSILSAIRAGLGIDRTSLARIANIDSDDEPEVVIVLEGDDREVHVSRKGGASPEVRERVGDDWRRVSRPVEWLRELIDTRAANPATLLSLKDEEFAAAVLEAMPLDGYDRTDALLRAGLAGFRLPAIPAGLHPLEDLELIEKAVFDARTEVNRQERSESDAAEKLLAGLPAEPLQSCQDEELRIRQERDRLKDEIATDLERGAQELKATLLESGRLEESQMGESARVRDAAIQAAEQAHRDRLAVFKQSRLERDTAARLAADARGAELNSKSERLSEINHELASLAQRADAYRTDYHVRQMAAGAKEHAEMHAKRSRELSDALEALRLYRIRLAERLPISGLSVTIGEDGKKTVTVDGVPRAQVNKARLAEIAVEVALLRAGPTGDGKPYLPIVLLDDAEKLDARARKALLKEIASRGSQVIAAVVGEGALHALTEA